MDVDGEFRALELFAGVGGFRLGLEREGWNVVWSNQWEPSSNVQHASDCYVGHFGNAGHSNDDLAHALDLTESEPRPIPDHDLLVGGFPCFAGGTLVMTAQGYRPIETLRVGEHVLTHRGRWRRITRVMSRSARSTVTLTAQGAPRVVTTSEHPFWARTRSMAWDAERRSNIRRFSEPSWTAASELDDASFISQVYPTEPCDPPFDIDRPVDFYWIVGRYLADGWRAIPGGEGTVVICASEREAAEVEERIRRVYPCTPSVERTVTKFHITRRDFYDWLEDFGSGAGGKRIPGWLMTISREQATALLEGYSTGDGSRWQGGWKATTVSRALGLGIALLIQHAYGVVASLHRAEVPVTTVIEGRTVNQRTQYQIVAPARNNSAFVEGAYGWKKTKHSRRSGAATVYNIAVDEDESYNAEGCVVHNCQDYSVAKSRNAATGIVGKKGVLWWEIHRLLRSQRPPYLFLENVDRLLKSPASQRGRDFGVMLSTLAELGYEVEWRVINAADYGFPQKRRRVLIVGRQAGSSPRDPNTAIHEGTLGRAFPAIVGPTLSGAATFELPADPVEVTESFGATKGTTPFRNAGYMSGGHVWTLDVESAWDGPSQTLADILEPTADVPERYFITNDDLPRWRYLKGAKREQRVHEGTDTPYFYAEGAIPFPDPTDRPARTILTGESGRTPSRFKHVVEVEDGRFRRLTPRELERLNGFPDDWTDTGMPEGRRGFMMGNALVVGLVERVGRELRSEIEHDRSDPTDRALRDGTPQPLRHERQP